MSSDTPKELPPPASGGQQKFPDNRAGATGQQASETAQRSDDATCREATVIVRGEVAPNQESSKKDPKSSDNDSRSTGQHSTGQQKSPPKEVSETKARQQSRLPALDDDADIGVQKEQRVTRDGKADLAFTGTLLASAAPDSAPNGHWQEYRVYRTSGGKHVFSKVTRSVFAEERDRHEAEIFDPAPSSMPTQLMRSVRDLAHSRPMQWTDAAAAFFGYDPLAKALYRKLDGRFDEHID